MSGGSFDYLYLAGLNDRADDLRLMADELRALGAEDAAADTEALIVEVDEDLRALWRAVEYFKSGDVGRDSVEERIVLYRRRAIR